MLSLVTVSPVITAFHSCCLSLHAFDQINLWPAWVGIETALFWQCSPGTVETQRFYPLRHGPRRGDQGWIFWSYKSNYLVFHSRVRTEYFIGNPFKTRFVDLRINFYLLRTFCPHLGSFFCRCFSRRFGQISPLGQKRGAIDNNYGRQ